VPAPAPAPPPLTHDQLAHLDTEIAKARPELEAARKDLASVEEALDLQSFGFYQRLVSRP
jgi:hypothetical protein